MAQRDWVVWGENTAFNIRFTLRRFAPRGSVRLAHFIRTAHCTHIFPALVFASQSPYTGWKNVVNLSRYVQFFRDFLKIKYLKLLTNNEIFCYNKIREFITQNRMVFNNFYNIWL
jgi:hypothetical protein